ncbi:IucA/IucC family protein [Kosakonia oryzae]|uniref:IucA/IucC family protein n=1 Tax=Kosakonia oryzae TaxID=497725 RepID=UPI001D089702|nr:IucA/IucC family protein [Kosakonia oryzae]UDJ81846.1 siderophore biosynthesis protein [Kosakonia oryzae]
MSVSLAVRENPLLTAKVTPQREQAEFAGLTALLNCYIREFARPAGRVKQVRQGNIPLSLASRMVAGKVILLQMGEDGSTLLAIRAIRWSLLDRGDFIGTPFVKEFGRPWRAVRCSEAMALLVNDMVRQTGQLPDSELLDQIENSVQVTASFLQHLPKQASEHSYIQSEERLLWGHPMHPSPKSRQGVTPEALLACSPEVAARFPLFWFRIHPSLLQVRGSAPVKAMLDNLHGEHCYPCHPWEVRHIMQSPLYTRAVSRGLITPLGLTGAEFAATSSVRTLYRADLPYYLKCSIHVRLTNCVRKNAWYELESAVALNTLLEERFARLESTVSGFHIMREPAASSLDFSALAQADEAEEVRHLQECFGILYRENLTDQQPWLAASLFALDHQGHSPLHLQIQQLSVAQGLSLQQANLLWLDRYLSVLLPGVLEAFFTEGMVFEPHLQNVLVSIENHLPAQLWVRDLEGTKLTTERWSASDLAMMSERARQSVWYSREQGWRRVAYCLLINHLSEVLFRLADDDQVMEQQLWDLLAAQLGRWRHQPEIAAILEGGPIPSKNNLKTRLLRKADKHADYTLLQHPMRSAQ